MMAETDIVAYNRPLSVTVVRRQSYGYQMNRDERHTTVSVTGK